MAEESPLSRRQLLAVVGGVGALSTAGASGSLGMFSDFEGFASSIDAGTVELDLDCADEGCVAGENRLTVPFDGVAPGETGSRRITVNVADGSNPVYLWFRTDCPNLRNALTTTLELQISLVRDCGGSEPERTTLIPWSRFDYVLETLRDGVALAGVDSACLDQSQQLCLDVEYRLPAGTEWLAGASVDLDFVFAALQCRHADNPEIPFAGRDCPPLDCTDCVALGKHDVTDDRLRPGDVYHFDEFYNGYGDDEHTYKFEVVTVTDKVDGDDHETVCASLALLQDGSEAGAPPICAVRVGARTDSITYEFEHPSTRTPEVCSTDDADDPTQPDNERPAISNLIVYVCPTDGDAEVTTDG